MENTFPNLNHASSAGSSSYSEWSDDVVVVKCVWPRLDVNKCQWFVNLSLCADPLKCPLCDPGVLKWGCTFSLETRSVVCLTPWANSVTRSTARSVALCVGHPYCGVTYLFHSVTEISCDSFLVVGLVNVAVGDGNSVPNLVCALLDQCTYRCDSDQWTLTDRREVEILQILLTAPIMWGLPGFYTVGRPGGSGYAVTTQEDSGRSHWDHTMIGHKCWLNYFIIEIQVNCLRTGR